MYQRKQALEKDVIVKIPKKRESYFGGSGNMLLPCTKTVASAIAKVPRGKVITLEQLRDGLAHRFKVQATCPFTLKLALRALAGEKKRRTPYWRVIRTNGQLIDYFPGGTKRHAALLRGDGFSVAASGKIKVLVKK